MPSLSNQNINITMPGTAIKRRKVFYLPGFDPRSDKYYQRLYKREASQWAANNNKTININNPARHALGLTFTVTNHSDDVSCDFSILSWSDIVKPYWSIAKLKLFYRLIKFYLFAYHNADWNFMSTLQKAPTKVFLFPLASILLLLIFVFGLTAFISSIIFLKTNPILLFFLGSSLAVLLYINYFLVLKVKSFWTLRMFLFHHDYIQGNECLSKRLTMFSSYINHQLSEHQQQYDEIVLIGHSYSSTLIPTIISNLKPELHNLIQDKFYAVTFANLFPLNTAFINTPKLHLPLKQLARSKYKLNWLDISSPADGACYFDCSPFLPVCKTWNINFKSVSPRFHTVINEKKYKTIKKNKFDLHFQYLNSTDSNSNTNYFQLTAGNKSLGESF